jgi:hypothetical protein
MGRWIGWIGWIGWIIGDFLLTPPLADVPAFDDGTAVFVGSNLPGTSLARPRPGGDHECSQIYSE